jgi:hypothetical protein
MIQETAVEQNVEANMNNNERYHRKEPDVMHENCDLMVSSCIHGKREETEKEKPEFAHNKTAVAMILAHANSHHDKRKREVTYGEYLGRNNGHLSARPC